MLYNHKTKNKMTRSPFTKLELAKMFSKRGNCKFLTHTTPMGEIALVFENEYKHAVIVSKYYPINAAPLAITKWVK